GLVADVGDAGDPTLTGQVADLHREVVGVHLVRQLRDDQARAPLDLLDLDDRAHRDRTTTRAVRLLDALGAQNLRARREVRAGDALDQTLEQLLATKPRVLQCPQRRSRDLAEVVR